MLKENPDLGKLLLRLTVGGLMLFHGIAKIGSGVDGIANMLENEGLPGFIAYGVYIGEVVAPLMLILGVKTRIAALIVAVNMAVAVFLAHPTEVLALNKHGSWAIELAAFFFFTALTIALLGPGKHKLKD